MAKTYTPEEVTQGLAALVVHHGSAQKAALALADEGSPIPVTTLTSWRDRDHAARYDEMVRRHAEELEAEAISRFRSLAMRAAEIEADLLERTARVSDRDVPQALRAVADVKSKSVDKLMALTGRSPEGRSELSMDSLLAGMAAKGLVKLNVNLDVAVPRPELEEGNDA